jgi:hypothetical protein
VRKKHFIIILLFITVDLLGIINLVNAFNCNLITLEADKTEFFIDEDIKINASWELNYNDINEIAYTQIQILDYSDDIIWNSSKHNEIGIFEKNWTVHIEQLNLGLNNHSIILYVKFFIFYFQIDTTNTMYTYLGTIPIKIFKRNTSCQLIGYRDHIKLGEDLSLIAKFYTESSGSSLKLTNQTIQFMISFNNLIIHSTNYTTNSLGEIYVNITSLTHLKPGQNILLFSIKNNKVFNDSKFVYNIYVDKNPIYIDIIGFTDTLKQNENLEIKLFYYFYINLSQEPLANYSILLNIIDNNTCVFTNEYKTDRFGILAINLSQEFFNFNQQNQEFIINISFNGTFLLEKKTFSLNLKLNQKINSEIYDSFQINFLSFFSILIVVLVLFSYLITNKRNKSEKLLTEITIRY